jgi:TolB-like protein
MTYVFDDFRLDLDAHELTLDGAAAPIEPQVFALLRLLIEHRDRLVSRDEIIETVWGGRIVSDAAVSSRVKSARRAIGDDGRAQRLIRTYHGLGFRFIGEVRTSGDVNPERRQPPTENASATTLRPSIAVLPFSRIGGGQLYPGLADALPHDLIVDLSRLRWLFVIARGSSFRFRGPDAVPQKVRAELGVRYCLSGAIEIADGRLRVTVELCDTEHGGIIWSQSYCDSVEAVHEIRATVARELLAALELRIPEAEAHRALNAPRHLDAWSAYHLGLAQMYRFDRAGVGRAVRFFEQAIEREPTFARAKAGLSFAHFQNVFLGFSTERRPEAQLAQRLAAESVELDLLDPFCNLVMGRAAWLRGDLESALPWLDRATELNPNYAQARHSSAWTRTLLGDGAQGQALADAAMKLSPLDPLLYGMLSVRSFSHMVLDEPAEAALWAERAARAPHAPPLSDLIAAVAHGLNGDDVRAATRVANALARQPGICAADFFEAFPFQSPVLRQRISRVFARLVL